MWESKVQCFDHYATCQPPHVLLCMRLEEQTSLLGSHPPHALTSFVLPSLQVASKEHALGLPVLGRSALSLQEAWPTVWLSLAGKATGVDSMWPRQLCMAPWGCCRLWPLPCRSPDRQICQMLLPHTQRCPEICY